MHRSLARRLRLLVAALGLALPAAASWAQADVWGFVDSQGTAHFAAERIDPRYQLFFRAGQSYDTHDLPGTDGATPHGAGVRPERLRTLIEISPGMKAVARHLRETATTAGLDFELLQALIATESGFDAAAVSPRGAVGLMQLMPATAQRWGVSADARKPLADKLTDPLTNIRAGTRYLRYLVDLFPGRLELALAAYNAGEGAVQRAGNRIPNYPETQNYVKTVMQLYQSLKPGVGARVVPLRVRMEIPATPMNATLPTPVPRSRRGAVAWQAPAETVVPDLPPLQPAAPPPF